ncbi:hypothetical protein [Micromonospora sp. IBHARD004]|uniref:hypothetical protein n=1 Tax=Micromonospora sp. IBHARD004 TaxID=3457764 RepID=UPI00405869DB
MPSDGRVGTKSLPDGFILELIQRGRRADRTRTIPGKAQPSWALPPPRVMTTRLASWFGGAGPLLFPILVVIVGCVAASRGDQGAIRTWGLVQALPWLYFLSVALLTGSFFLELFGHRREMRQFPLAVHLVGLVVLLHGAPAFLEQEPRFATAWLHAGFTGQILEHQVSPGGVDARFNWPGFFSAAAAVTGSGGLDSAIPLLRWAPIFIVLLYLPPIYVIGRQLTGSRTATWLGLWFFVLVNWVGQDYFAPQSLGFVLYLMAVALIIAFFRQPSRASSVSRNRLPWDGLPDVEAGPGTRLAVAVLLLLLTGAIAVSHQLSPIMLVLVSAALVLVGRFRLALFPVIALVMVLGWISVGTTAYWVGHLHTLFGGFGNVQEVVSNSVGERIGGSPAHLAVVKLRLAFTALVWSAMGASTLRLWIRKRPPITLFTLVVVPFLTLAQDYGNEGVLRIFLFSAPFACLVIGQAVLGMLRMRWVRPAVIAAALLSVPLFLTTRYGNESFEQVRSDEVAAIRALYRLAPPDSDLISLTSQVPWRFAYATEHDYSRPTNAEGFLAGDREAVRGPVGGETRRTGRAYLIVTRSQEIYAYESLGQRENWFDTVQPLLTRENGYRLLFHNEEAWIYEYESTWRP